MEEEELKKLVEDSFKDAPFFEEHKGEGYHYYRYNDGEGFRVSMGVEAYKCFVERFKEYFKAKEE